jgi:hypothetical protein
VGRKSPMVRMAVREHQREQAGVMGVQAGDGRQQGRGVGVASV